MSDSTALIVSGNEGYRYKRECTEIESDEWKIMQFTSLDYGPEAAGQMT